jgi:hypothetical protein
MRYLIALSLICFYITSCHHRFERKPSSETVDYRIRGTHEDEIMVNINHLDSPNDIFPLGVSPIHITVGKDSTYFGSDFDEQIMRRANYSSPVDTVFRLTMIVDGRLTSVSQMDSIIRRIHVIIDSSYSRFSIYSIDVYLST